MASAHTGAAVEVETRIAASPETVFDFFTDPDKMIQWMGRSAELDPRPGGAFRCDINGRDVAGDEYVEVDPPRDPDGLGDLQAPRGAPEARIRDSPHWSGVNVGYASYAAPFRGRGI
ncbi:MAG TPA: SRPBCC domain-containing protein [Solirubrobacterales bacterium]|nr:SRPBCC domain-containing protein [Solirubrobacterales bacterium]